tara:strand:+ start:34 stop:1014 length:981 start_codon:yes stop_codon:yes gene_type:complete
MKIKKYNIIAKNVIETEITSLRKLKKNINISFEKAVKAILNCKNGKVVISGTGKSGIIGKKISSTFSSIGIPSFFVDAGACSHGDLGVISSNDVVILISNSGESEELKNIIQYIKRNKKIILIGIVSKKNSILYKSANIKLLVPNVKEADPAGIVPTSSTIIQLSIGDALAIATMKQRNFGKLDFKKFHPSGALGTKLKTVEDLMVTKNKLPLVYEYDSMKTGLKIISKKNLGALIVQNKKKEVVGIISDGDIKRANNKFKNINNIITKDIMSKKPISVEKNTLAAEALAIMNNKKIHVLCVHNKKNYKKIIGLLSVHNILKANIQ